MTVEVRQDDAEPEAAHLLALAQTMESDGRLLDAIDTYTSANRVLRDPVVERRILRLRFETFAHSEPSAPAEPWPTVAPGEPWPDPGRPPVLAPADLTVESLSTGVQRHGFVFVRGLVPAETCERLRAGSERVLEAQHHHLTENRRVRSGDELFEPFACPPGSPKDQAIFVGTTRRFLWMGEAAMAFDAPRVSLELFDALAESGVTRVITEYLGERPCMALDKCTLRRAGQRYTGGEWHQDGSTLQSGVRTMGVWLALTPCGTEAPGLDVVPRRIDHIVEMGTEGSTFSWSVSEDLVEARYPGETIRPEFSAGDALVFDDLLLHRTTVDPTMTKVRYAAEVWYFSPSACPRDRVLAML